MKKTLFPIVLAVQHGGTQAFADCSKATKQEKKGLTALALLETPVKIQNKQ